ncbi:MAG: methionine aminotransferase [Deltaproteobacteria bacterium]|nr:methionine aminotransferase [Deltaproteobacteria bacterium]
MPDPANLRARAALRIEGFGTSIFTEMSRLALVHKALNLGQGFPDFPAPEFIKEAAKRAIDANHNQYAPAIGIGRLRHAVAARWMKKHATGFDADTEITVTQGATEALFCTTLALCNPGDEVILFEPAYDAYAPDVRLAGGSPRFVQLHPPDFRIDEIALRAAITPRTRLIVINSPHNPTGKVFSTAELDLIAKLCVEHDLVALSDEVYSEMVYGDAVHVPLCTRPGMRDRTVTIDSIGKTFSVTGWKIGWTLAASELTHAIRATHQWVTFCNATPFQEAAADALQEAETNGYYPSLVQAYGVRRGKLQHSLAAANLNCLPIAGSYFLLADISKTAFPNDVDFCRHLLLEAGVAAIPPSAFYANPADTPPLVRFCFAKSDAVLDEAAVRLSRCRF